MVFADDLFLLSEDGLQKCPWVGNFQNIVKIMISILIYEKQRGSGKKNKLNWYLLGNPVPVAVKYTYLGIDLT